MTYNIHPILVHFPIAFLFLYSIIKIIPLGKYFPQVAWKQIERVLLLVGVLGAFVAMSTGEIAEHMVSPNHKLVETHSSFALTSTWIYGLLLLGEILTLIIPFIAQKINFPQIIKFLTLIEKTLTNNALSKIMALLGLITITLTGMLGGIMVYGISADPLAPVVLKIFGITL